MLKARAFKARSVLTRWRSRSVLKCSHGDAVAEAEGEAVGDAVGDDVGDAVGPVVSRGVVLGVVAGDVLGCGPTGSVGAS
jgi:hypothetical protein